MNLLELLKKINPNFTEFLTQEIRDEKDAFLGYKSFGTENDKEVFAGGTATTKEVALRIAIAEAFERSYVDLIAKGPQSSLDFDMKAYPSSSGFAAGFDKESTRFRAICEGLERWAWSKWIDEHYNIPSLKKYEYELSALSRNLINSFDEYLWFKKDFVVDISPTEKLELSLVIFLGIHGNGIFPGSRVSTSQDDLFQHPIIEAHRNLTNALLSKTSPVAIQDIIQERTHFFAENKSLALSQVEKALISKWPVPEIKLLKEFPTESNELFIYRCLFKDFVGWHEGAVDRFVY